MRKIAPFFLVGVVSAIAAACGSSGVDEATFGPVPSGVGEDATADGYTPQFDNDGGLSAACKPQSCAEIGAACGPQGDGCGGALPTCGGCKAGELCMGIPSRCVPAASAAPTCTKKTCADYPGTCGPQADGCGGQTPDCGGCVAPDICGGGGVPSKCGGGNRADGGACVPKKCTDLGKDCGLVADGCGTLMQCGATCKGADICGGGGVPNVCGGGTTPDGGAWCAPRTCAAAGANCGYVADGCGGLLNCNGADAGADAGSTCPPGQFCGGAGPNRCGTGLADAGPTCTGLCAQQVKCDGGGTTTVTGTVYAPGGPNSPYGALPIPGAVVYVPNGAVQPFAPGVSCSQCSAEATGSPLVSTTTAPDGTFRLTNVPAGANIPLVMQLGRWRRQITINVAPCTNNPLLGAVTRLAANQGEGDIPLMAIATGNVDGLECVLRKMGISDSEFTGSRGTGRVRLYPDNGASPPGPAGLTADDLWGSPSELAKFDAVINACRGRETRRSSAHQQNLVAYADVGGRVFATHFSYVWLYGRNPAGDPNPTYVNPWRATGSWAPNTSAGDPLTAFNLDVGVGKVALFAQWLNTTAVNALDNGTPTATGLPLPAQPRIAVEESRHDLSPPLTSPAERWAYATASSPDPSPFSGTPGPGEAMTLHYAFNTPWGGAPASQCGRVVFSDYHVTLAGGGTGGTTFPNECNTVPLTAQEKLLAYMFFDLTTCITTTEPPSPPSCKKLSCADQGLTCGPAGDGCSGVIQNGCGGCAPGQTCGGGGTPGVCGGPACTKKTCQTGQCGLLGDGCGGQLDCGNPCLPNQNCGGGGPNLCGGPTCAPRKCADLGAECGLAGDGCGKLLDCGPCAAPKVCGADNKCVASSCAPRTCEAAGANCGALADGCGGLLDCGTCPPGRSCGAGGVANRCSDTVPPR